MEEVRAKVNLIQHTFQPEAIVSSAARICYASDAEKAFEHDSAKDDEFVRMLRRLGHMSPFEHVSFTFYIEGVSRAMTHQLVRHRMASYSQRSQRYVAHDEFDYVIPPQIEGKKIVVDGKEKDLAEFYRETMETIAEKYRQLNDALGREGETSNEDARYILPNACETKIVVSMNARELMHFFNERLCLRAQWEIRGVSEKMLALAKQVAPVIFENAGPKCLVTNHCPEGKMTCGQFEEIKKRYT